MPRYNAILDKWTPWQYKYKPNGVRIDTAYPVTFNSDTNFVLGSEYKSEAGSERLFIFAPEMVIDFYTAIQDAFEKYPAYLSIDAKVIQLYKDNLVTKIPAKYDILARHTDQNGLLLGEYTATGNIDNFPASGVVTIAKIPIPNIRHIFPGHKVTVTFLPSKEFISRADLSTTYIKAYIGYTSLNSIFCNNGGNPNFKFYDKLASANNEDDNLTTVIYESNSIECGYKPYGTIVKSKYQGSGANRYNYLVDVSDGTYTSSGVFNTFTQVVEANSQELGYKPRGYKLSEYCATSGENIYSLMGVYSTGLFNADTGEFSTYEAVIERNAVQCGYKPRGTFISSSCSVAGDNFRPHEMIGHFSEGTYDKDGVFNTYDAVVDPRSISCGYVPTGNVTFTSNAPTATFEVSGKGIYKANQTVNNWSLGTYSYIAKAPEYANQTGEFTVTTSGVVVSATFTVADSPSFFQFQGAPHTAKVSEILQGKKVFLGFTSPTRPLKVEEGQYTLVIEKEGFTSQTVQATGVIGQTVKVNYNLTELPKAQTDSVYYEAVLTDPLTYKVVDREALKDAFNFTYSDKFRELSEFSFSIPLSVGEFHDVTSSPNGQLGVLLYINGIPKVQGIIKANSPSGEGFTNVNCIEILGGLDDAWNGHLDLNNIEFEYTPSDGVDGNADSNTQYEYWNYGFGKSNFFYTDAMGESNKVAESSNGVLVPEGNQNTLKLRPFKARKISSYTAHFKGYGKPFTSFIFDEANSVSVAFDGLRFNITNRGNTVASSPIIEKYIIGGGQQDIYESLSNADVYYTARYEILSSKLAKVSFSITIIYLGLMKTYEIQPVKVAIAEPDLIEPAFNLGSNSGIAKFYVEAREKVTLLDWLNRVGNGQEGYHSVKVRFQQGLGSKVSDTALRLSYEDPSRWNVVKDILDLAGSVNTEYVGVLDGVPTYLVHDLDELPKLRKFYNAGEVFNASYHQDLANVFNVLTVRASDSTQGYNQTTNNTIVITISPSAERPNRLGRLRHQIIGAEGIRDIQTLTKYALSVYDEHSKPSEPVEFETFTNNEWLNVMPGQTASVYGLPDGKVINNKVVSINFSESSGITRVELGEVLSMSEAIQRKLKANTF